MAKFKFRPDYNSDNNNHPTNGERAEWAEKALCTFTKLVGDDEPRTNIQDLICDLGHLYDRVRAESDEDIMPEEFDEVVRWALENWREER